MSSIALNRSASALQQLKTINLLAQSTKLCTSGNIGLISGRVVKFNTHWDERKNLQVTDGMRAACDSLRDTLKGLVADALKGQDDAIRKICATIDGGADKPLLERSVVVKIIRDVEGCLEKATSLQNTDTDLAAYSSTHKNTTFGVQKRLAQNARAWDLGNQIDNLPPAKRREVFLEYVGMCASLIGDTFAPSGEARRKFDDMVGEYVKALKSFPSEHPFTERDVYGTLKNLGVFARVVNGGESLSLSEADGDIGILREAVSRANEDRMLTSEGIKYPRMVAQLSALMDRWIVLLLGAMNPQELASREADKDYLFTPAELYKFTGQEQPKNWFFDNTYNFASAILDYLRNKPQTRELPSDAPLVAPSPDNARADKTPVRVVTDWQKGVPKLEKGCILRQTSGASTCFACSVFNGIAQSDALRAHFESLIDRTANPPTITLCTKKGRRMTFSLDETFGLDEKMVTRINKNLNATDFERFFMRYLAAVDPLYTPGQPGNDYEVATALGLVSRGVKSMSQNEITWSQLVDHVKNDGFATLNLNMAHFQTVVAADENGCEILDSLDGKSFLSKEDAVKKWGAPNANIYLTLYGTVPPARIDQFQRGVQGVSFKDAVAGIQAKIDGVVAERDKLLAQLQLDGKTPDVNAISAQQRQRTAWYEQNKKAVVKILELHNKVGPKWLKVCQAMKSIGEESFEKVKADFFVRETGDVGYRSIFSNTFPSDESQIHAYCVAGLSEYIGERVMDAQRA